MRKSTRLQVMTTNNRLVSNLKNGHRSTISHIANDENALCENLESSWFHVRSMKRKCICLRFWKRCKCEAVYRTRCFCYITFHCRLDESTQFRSAHSFDIKTLQESKQHFIFIYNVSTLRILHKRSIHEAVLHWNRLQMVLIIFIALVYICEISIDWM